LSGRESGAVGFRFHRVAGGKESDGGRRSSGRDVMWFNNRIGHEGEFENVLFSLALFRVTTSRDTYRWVFGQMSYEVAIAEGVRAEAG
jgi:hypothetical protein